MEKSLFSPVVAGGTRTCDLAINNSQVLVLAIGIAPWFVADSNRLRTGMTFWSSRLLSLTWITPSPRRREGKWNRGEGEG